MESWKSDIKPEGEGVGLYLIQIESWIEFEGSSNINPQTTCLTLRHIFRFHVVLLGHVSGGLWIRCYFVRINNLLQLWGLSFSHKNSNKTLPVTVTMHEKKKQTWNKNVDTRSTSFIYTKRQIEGALWNYYYFLDVCTPCVRESLKYLFRSVLGIKDMICVPSVLPRTHTSFLNSSFLFFDKFLNSSYLSSIKPYYRYLPSSHIRIYIFLTYKLQTQQFIHYLNPS